MNNTLNDLATRVSEHLMESDASYQLRNRGRISRFRTRSAADFSEDARLGREVLRGLRETDTRTLTTDQRNTAGYLRHLATGWIDTDEYRLLNFSITPYARLFRFAPLYEALKAHALEGPDDADRYLLLVSDYRAAVDQLRVDLREQADNGIFLPRPAITGVRSALLAAAETAFDRVSCKRDGDTLSSAFGTQLEPLAEEIRDAYVSAASAFDERYESAAPDRVGLGQYERGAENYRALIGRLTTSSLGPSEIHEIGLAQVADLGERMEELESRLVSESGRVSLREALATESRFYARSPEEVEALYLRHMEALAPHLSEYFSVLPAAPYGVARVAPELEPTLTFGFYEWPTATDPVGRYRYNGSELDKRSLLSAAALIFHELAPGHHFHIARQLENPDLPELRRDPSALWAFAEGWAEYASGLCSELGLYSDPYDAYGRLVQERFTAVRMVVDTGMNDLGWSLDQARDYMRVNTMDSDVQIASETLRYSTDIPAHALAYRLGWIEFERLRTLAKNQLGARFDIKEFHEVLLAPGSLPFGIVAENVDDWIAGVLGGTVAPDHG
ncbi:DUF885 domain-containing protein [Tsukamurella asaccharolytica]|uniref:DUF885 domain-containing protein n=1 Tax=Tsukamurella asaccharolytica TaxID=2592067 RepID=A0A5C5REE8_9ACTN|nr:DUF885 domain-containing protein [Tsukamurella asaccharolytica]TWS20505.1 DUF885 domain-containing protein [Tsukamurella asaccharolytica]